MMWFVDTYVSGDGIDVLDVGSYDLNGSFKELFGGIRSKYTGLDIIGGRNVDIVPSRPYDWEEIQADSFDVVISGNVLEHVEFPWITFSEMVRVLKPGGLLCIIVPNGFREHRYPVDCWRFFTDGVIALARSVQLEVLHAHTNAAPSSDSLDWFSFWGRAAETMLVARKTYSGDPQEIDYSNYKICVPDQKHYLGNFVTYESLSIKRKFHLFLNATSIVIRDTMKQLRDAQR